MQKHCYQFSLGLTTAPKKDWKQCLCKPLEGEQRVLWYFTLLSFKIKKILFINLVYNMLTFSKGFKTVNHFDSLCQDANGNFSHKERLGYKYLQAKISDFCLNSYTTISTSVTMTSLNVSCRKRPQHLSRETEFQ